MEYTLSGDYFDGAFHRSSKQDENIAKYSPANLDHYLWEGKVNYSHIEPVIHSAIDGFNKWRKTTFKERIAFLEKYKEIAESKKDEIARAIALETGKPLWESLTEAAAITAKVNVTISDSLKRIEQSTIKNILPNIDGHFIYKPIGPTLIIGPFNFPCHLANGQILSNLLAGNSVIFKPSEKTMYSSELLIKIFHQAGFPKGVVNLIQGTAKTTQDILKHPKIKGIYFTGSYGVGQKILASTYQDLSKLVALEMGGKNTTIINDDVNIDHALPEILRACFLSSGQRCTSTSMIAVHEKIKDEFIDKFTELTKRIIVDHPIDFKKDPFMGPLIDQVAEDSYFKFTNLGKNNGAEEIIKAEKIQTGFKGYYVSPSIHYLNKVSKDNPFTQTEIFGPNATFSSFSTIEEAIKIANISDYGLAASIFTQDKNIYTTCIRDIDAGIINLNRSTVGASSRLPFGGVKNSGNYKPAAVSMIDHCVASISSLETTDQSSSINDVKGLR